MREFIRSEDRLPEPDVEVEVKGEYVPANTGFPRAHLHLVQGRLEWSSNEWRGMVAITHWRALEK